MKRIYLIFVSLLTIGIAGCSDFLDTVPADKYDDATVWGNPGYAERFVLNIYATLPYPYSWIMGGAVSDEQVSVQEDGGITRTCMSQLTPDDPGVFQYNWMFAMNGWWWKDAYANVRACNKFLANVDNIPFATVVDKNILTSEVHFLRAYLYFLLMAQYGGVPLIDKPIEPGDNYQIPRSSFAQTIKFITDDLQAAIDNEDFASQSDKTRATLGAALAMKSRVLLYAASEMHHDLSWAGSYAHPELIGYVAADGVNRHKLYEDAKKAAEDCMELGYSLYDVNSDKGQNFADLFLQLKSDEQIFITFFDKKNNNYWQLDWPGWVCNAPCYGGYALNQITGNLANAFENADGTYFDWNTQKDDPYTGRDPRFYGTVLYNGAPWYYNYWGISLYNVNINIAPDGADYNNGNTTGYYMKKFIDPAGWDWWWGKRQPQPYIQIRYAEVLLNYVEACIGINDEVNARRVLTDLRHRAGMPAVTDSGAALVKRYRNERRVELALEGHRFFDVRRWLAAPDAYVPIKGVKYNGTAYEERIYEQRAWNNSHYLVPILRSEIQKDKAIIQNPLYN